MFKNYLLIAFRNLVRNKSYSIINIAGLSVGIAAFLLIALFIQDELGYENFHQKADRIYRLSPPDYARTAPRLSPTIKAEFPEVESAVRLKTYSGIIKQGDISHAEEDLVFAGQDVLNIFSFDFLDGSPAQALTDPNTLILDEDHAIKYFNSTQVVGKQLLFQDSIPLTVTGVYKNWSANSHLDLGMLASFPTYENMGVNLETWSNNIYYTYVLLEEKTDPASFRSKLPAFLDKHIRSLPNRKEYDLVAQHVKDIHLYSAKDMEWAPNGSISTVYIFSALALMILIIAIINFTNLSTAIASRRAREIGVRKTIGAGVRQIVGQFLFESILLSVITLCISLVIVQMSLPYLNELAMKSLSIDLLSSLPVVLILLAFAVLVGICAGFYPALVLSSFHPLEVFRGESSKGLKGSVIRKGLVLVQFALSLFLLVSSILVSSQLDFMKNKALGFDKEQVLVIPYSWDAKVQRQYEVLKEEFLQNPAVQYVTQSGDIPGRMATQMGYWAEGMPEDEAKGMQALFIDKDFSEVYGLEMLAGRAMNNEISTDIEEGFLLNERAVAEIGWTPEEAIGKRFASHKEGRVIGVVKDFHYNSLQQSVQPLFLFIRPEWAGYISLRINTSKVDQLISSLENTWNAFIPDRPFQHIFLDEDYNRLYQSETRMGKVVQLFTILAIFIACIGLFGLTTFTIEKRNKEIAIRKVMGASVSRVVWLLSGDFFRPILLAVLIATPLVFWLGKKWLNNFAYQTEIKPAWFIVSTLVLIALAWISLAYQAIKAARVNPVKWLKEE